MAHPRPTALFDRWSASYDDPRLQWTTYRPIHDAVLARSRDLEPARVVDLGCGTGQLTQRLVKAFPRATTVAIDLSPAMLEKAGRRLTAGRMPAALVRADAQHLPFADRSVDLVVCTESFHWYPDQRRALDEVARVLRPGGRLMVASIAMTTDVGDRILTAASGASGVTIRARPPHRLRRLLRGSEFEVVHQRRIPRFGFAMWPVLTEARRR